MVNEIETRTAKIALKRTEIRTDNRGTRGLGLLPGRPREAADALPPPSRASRDPTALESPAEVAGFLNGGGPKI